MLCWRKKPHKSMNTLKKEWRDCVGEWESNSNKIKTLRDGSVSWRAGSNLRYDFLRLNEIYRNIYRSGFIYARE